MKVGDRVIVAEPYYFSREKQVERGELVTLMEEYSDPPFVLKRNGIKVAVYSSCLEEIPKELENEPDEVIRLYFAL